MTKTSAPAPGTISFDAGQDYLSNARQQRHAIAEPGMDALAAQPMRSGTIQNAAAFAEIRDFIAGIRRDMGIPQEFTHDGRLAGAPEAARSASQRFAHSLRQAFPTIRPGSEADERIQAVVDNANAYTARSNAGAVIKDAETHVKQWQERITRFQSSLDKMPADQQRRFAIAAADFQDYARTVFALREHHEAMNAKAPLVLQSLAEQQPRPQVHRKRAAAPSM